MTTLERLKKEEGFVGKEATMTIEQLAKLIDIHIDRAVKKCNKAHVSSRLIDKVTVTNLDIALRVCNIQLDKKLTDKIIDLIELIEKKGDDASIKDILQLQTVWANGC